MFTDRNDAGRRLAVKLSALRAPDVVVLGLPRGGVPVAFHVAREMRAPLDVLIVRKLGLPSQPEVAMGAIGEGGVRVVNEAVVSAAKISSQQFAAVERYERRELARRVARFRGGRAPVPLDGKTALIVDDGIATGSTARAACQVARALGAARVVLASPVAAPDTAAELHRYADQVICLDTPRFFRSIGGFYTDFTQTTEAEVNDLLGRATRAAIQDGWMGRTTPQRRTTTGCDTPNRGHEVEVMTESTRLPGRLSIPENARGVVIFAHGSGSSRHSPRNRFVANLLAQAGLGTLLLDLLTPREGHDRANVFNIELLAQRLVEATTWLRQQPNTPNAGIGYFGASTGAAAALLAAADPDVEIAAVVSRGGRPDLVGPRLGQVRAPTLLIVGGRDPVVLELNRKAQTMLHCETRLAIIPGATHLFEEAGALRETADLAADWLLNHLGPHVPSTGTARELATRSRTFGS